MTHGGKRPNAGRPKQVEHFARRTVYIDQQHVDMIESHRLAMITPRTTFSQALRAMLDMFREK